MMYFSALVAVSFVAGTFGSYAYPLLPAGLPNILVEVFSAAIILIFMFINLDGAKSMTRMENVVVLIKMSVLVVFAIAGLVFFHARTTITAYLPTDIDDLLQRRCDLLRL